MLMVKVIPKSEINTPKWENNDPCPFYIGVFSSPGLAYLIHPSTKLKLQGGSLQVHVVYCKWPNKINAHFQLNVSFLINALRTLLKLY